MVEIRITKQGRKGIIWISELWCDCITITISKIKFILFWGSKGKVRGKHNIYVSQCYLSVIDYLLFHFKIEACISPIWLKLSNAYPDKVFLRKWSLVTCLGIMSFLRIPAISVMCIVLLLSHRVSGFKGTLIFLWFNHSQSSWTLYQNNTQCLNIPNDGELTDCRSSTESSRKLITKFLKSLLYCKCERNIKLDQWEF